MKRRTHKARWLCVVTACLAVAAGSAARADRIVHAAAGPGGAVSPAGSVAVPLGGELTVTVSPSNGWHVADVLVDGRSVGPVPVYTFVGVASNRTLTASFHIPWAARVVGYQRGTNAVAAHRFSQAALGEPSRTTSYGVEDVTMFQPPWMTNEVVSIGSGGELVVEFDHPLLNDARNPFGADLLVFGNTPFTDISPLWDGVAGGCESEPGLVSVSQDGSVWHEIPGAAADSLFPTLGFRNTSAARYVANGSLPTSFVKPVNPALSWNNRSFAELVALYDGSGGGAGIDIGAAGLDWVRYVKVRQPAGQTWSTEVDAFSDVAPSLRSAVTVEAVAGTSVPAAGTYAATSGVPFTCAADVSAGAGPAERHICAGWTAAGAVPAAGTGLVARFTPDGRDVTLRWLAVETQYLVRASSGTGGAVAPTGGWFRAGTSVLLRATPVAGHAFAGWEGDTTGAAAEALELRFDAAGPRTVQARFEAWTAHLPGLAAWLAAHRLTLLGADLEAEEDRDEDGFAAWQEFLAGTQPTNVGSRLRVLGVTVSGGTCRVRWAAGDGGGGGRFRLCHASAPHGPWLCLPPAAPPSGGVGEAAHAPASAGKSVFYRITAERP